MVVALAPVDAQIAARQSDRHCAAGATQPRRRHCRCAGSRTARLGQPGTALPGAHDQMLARDHLRQRDIGALRKHRVVLEHRSDLPEIVAVDIIHPEDRMRIAHADGAGRVQDRIVDRPDLQLDRAGVLERLGERDFVPGEARLAHVHRRNERSIALPAIEQTGRGLEGQRALAGLLEDELGHAAHAVAARTSFGAVVVVDADERLGAGRARRVQGHELVVGGTGRLCRRMGLGRADQALFAAHVHHHDLVAEAVHLGEGMVGEHAHGESPWLPPYMGKLLPLTIMAGPRRGLVSRNIEQKRPKYPDSLTVWASVAIRQPAPAGRGPPVL